MDKPQLKILLAGDDSYTDTTLRPLFAGIETLAFELAGVTTYAAALAAMQQQPYDLYLLAASLGGRNGLDFLSQVLPLAGQAPLIFLTERTDYAFDLPALKAGASDCLAKDRLDAISLERSIRFALERAKSWQALLESEASYRRLVELSPDAIIVHNYQQITFGNPAAATLFGAARPAELVGQSFLTFIHPDQHAETQEYLNASEAANKSFGMVQGKFMRLDGWAIDFESVETALTFQGQAAVLSVIRDITERRHLERQIKQLLDRSQRHVQASIELAQVIATAPVIDVLFRQVVNLVQERLGYYHVQIYTLKTPLAISPAESRLGDNYLVLQEGTGEVSHILIANNHRIPLITDKSLVAQAARTGEPILASDVSRESNWLPNVLLPATQAEFVVPIKLAHEVLGVLDVQNDTVDSLSADDQLVLTGICGQIAIALHHHRIEESLRASEAKLAEAQQIAHIGSWTWNIQTNVVEWSDELYRIFGLTSREIEKGYSETFFRFVHLDDIEMVSTWVNEWMRTLEKVYSIEHRIVRSDGQIRFVHQYGKTIYNEKDQPVWCIGTTQDITERKQAEEALKDYSERLQELVVERTAALETAQEQLMRQERLAVLGQLAGGVAHELRNPLGVISNAVYFLSLVLAESDETVTEYLGIITSRVRETEKIVADLLNLARTQPAERHPIALVELITEALANIPANEQVKVTVTLPDKLDPVYVDRQQLRQVLVNLISNAYQAMPTGGDLSFSVETEPEQIRLLVSDSGAGMSPEMATKIFEPLYTTKPKGIGLGLTVSKNLVEVNQGKIEVTSQVGQGSIFTITLPTTERTAKP